MHDFQLKNHIPVSGPATREPVNGDEPDFRISLGFVPRWYHQRLGIDFSKAWHTDPVYRYDALLLMKRHLHETFPMIPGFRPALRENGIEPSCATLSGVFGIKLMPMLYGMQVKYSNDDWPDNLAGDVLSKEHLAGLAPFDLDRNPVFIQLNRQMDTMEEHFGMIHGYLNYQGILNIALKLRGNDLFMDFYDDPGFVHHLFSHIAGTILQVSKKIQKRQCRSGFPINLLSMSNCVMNMVSPETYREFVLPHDVMLSGQYPRFGIHTCNWNITPYIDVLRKIKPMGYLDMGMVSDMAKVRDVFPEARRAVLYPPMELMEKPMDLIRKDLHKIFRDLAPCDIVMADITESTGDDTVRAFIKLVEEVSNNG
ncbi:MAG: hypothetical protein R6W96_00450, partial [Clostridia bacterium]